MSDADPTKSSGSPESGSPEQSRRALLRKAAIAAPAIVTLTAAWSKGGTQVSLNCYTANIDDYEKKYGWNADEKFKKYSPLCYASGGPYKKS